MTKRRFVYHVNYIMSLYGSESSIDVIASSKAEAYDLATFEAIPAKEGSIPYGAYVSSVTYANGNYREFNTFVGNPT